MMYGPRMVTNTNRSESPQRNSMTTLNENEGVDSLERTQSGSSKLAWSDVPDLSAPRSSATGAPMKQVLSLRAESPSGVRSSAPPAPTLSSDQGPPKRQDSIPLSSDMPLPDFLKLNCQWHWPHSPTDNHIEVDNKRLPTGLRSKRVIRAINQVLVIAAESLSVCGFEGILAVKITLWDSLSLQKEARNEVERLKEIRHNHIVALVGWYTGPSRQGVLMFPAASWDLRTYVDKASEYNERYYTTRLAGKQVDEHEHIPHLRAFFACLCQALIYLHTNEIKHRDIKPENILVDKYHHVMLTDFGTSKKYTKPEDALTSGLTRCTVKYASPQVLDGHPREYDSDVYSLGCVFLEMATVILGRSLGQLYEKVGVVVDTERILKYGRSEVAIKQWIQELKDLCETNYSLASTGHTSKTRDGVPMSKHLLNVICSMMSEERDHRPTVGEAWKDFAEVCEECKFCHPNHHSDWPHIYTKVPRSPTQVHHASPRVPGSPSTGSGSISAAKQGAAHAPGTIVEGEQRIEVPGKLVEGSTEQPAQTTETSEDMPKATTSTNQADTKMVQDPQIHLQQSNGRPKLPDTVKPLQQQRSITFRETEDNRISSVEPSASIESESHKEQSAKQAKPDDAAASSETNPTITVNPDTRTSSADTILPTNSPVPNGPKAPLPDEHKSESFMSLNGLKDTSKDGDLSREMTRSEEASILGRVTNEETHQSQTSENALRRTHERHSWDQNSRIGRSSFMPPIWGNSEKKIGKKVIFYDVQKRVVEIRPTNSINQMDGVLVELPRFSEKAGRQFHTPVEMIDLWKLLTPAMNARRMFSNIRYMWLTGDDRIGGDLQAPALQSVQTSRDGISFVPYK